MGGFGAGSGQMPSVEEMRLAQNAFIRVNTMHNQHGLLHCDICSFVMLRCSYIEILARLDTAQRFRVPGPASKQKGGPA
jgi:hypothetical protein